MPHCIIEYANPVAATTSPANIIAAVHNGAVNSELFNEKDIKTRALGYDHYQVGTEQTDFIHVNAKILSGRNAEQKKQLSDAIIQALAGLGLEKVSLTVEVIDMDREIYGKLVVG